MSDDNRKPGSRKRNTWFEKYRAQLEQNPFINPTLGDVIDQEWWAQRFQTYLIERYQETMQTLLAMRYPQYSRRHKPKPERLEQLQAELEVLEPLYVFLLHTDKCSVYWGRDGNLTDFMHEAPMTPEIWQQFLDDEGVEFWNLWSAAIVQGLRPPSEYLLWSYLERDAKQSAIKQWERTELRWQRDKVNRSGDPGEVVEAAQ